MRHVKMWNVLHFNTSIRKFIGMLITVNDRLSAHMCPGKFKLLVKIRR